MMNDAMLRETVRDYQKAPDPDTRKTYYEAIRDALRPPPDLAPDQLTAALEAADPDAPSGEAAPWMLRLFDRAGGNHWPGAAARRGCCGSGSRRSYNCPWASAPGRR